MKSQYLRSHLTFPDPETALDEPNGLLAIGGDLSSNRLIEAYQKGIFPWYNPGEPILWWSPDPRAVIYPDSVHVSRSLKKLIRQNPYRITLNYAFAAVIFECASIRPKETWIGPEIRYAYLELHQQGLAHSVEVWLGDVLVGGLYGVSQGKIFCGESMFSKQDNASKFALVALCQHLVHHDFKLIDSQIINPHTESLGAIEIPRTEYLRLLKKYQHFSPENHCWDAQELVINQ